MVALKAEHRLEDLLQAAGLSRSTFFYHQARLDQPDPHEDLKTAITRAFGESHGRYGHRRIHHVLSSEGHVVAKKTVLKLMRELGLSCHVRRRRRYMSWRGRVGHIADNIVNRDFTSQAPNRKWVSDVTEFRLGDQKVYLSPVMDLFDHQVIAFTIGTSPNLHLTNQSLDLALSHARASDPHGLIEPGLVVHTDQGFQYQHVSWQRRLAMVGAIQSMSRRGNCYDNAVIENFFGHLKTEAFYHERPTSLDALTQLITDYIHWWNNHRIHTRIEGLSPVQYRAQALVA